MCAPTDFCTKFIAQQFLFEAFLAASSPEVNLLSHFSTLFYFKDGNFWSSLAPLLEEIDICAHWLFCLQFNDQQLLFEAFLDIMRIFLAVLSPKVNLLSHFCTCTSIVIIVMKPVTLLQNIRRVPLFVYIQVITPWFLCLGIQPHFNFQILNSVYRV